MKIIKLVAENIKRLSAVEITPDDKPVQIVGGKNAAGKSSVLDCITYAFGGKSLIPDEPLRRGEKKGCITIDVDGDEAQDIPPFTATLALMPGRSSLKITAANGMRLSSPQALLNRLWGRFAHDPLEFSRSSPAKQAETLRGLVGLDFTAIENERGQLYAERTTINRDAKAVKARLGGAESFPDAPAEEVSVAELVKEHQRRQKVNREQAAVRHALKAREEADRLELEEITAESDRIARLKEELARAIEAYRQRCMRSQNNQSPLREHRQQVADLTDEDTAEVERQIGDSETVNCQVRDNQHRKILADDLAALETKATRLTEQIEQLDADKQAQLESAAWPVEGLGFAADGITFQGLPFEQASSAESLRVSMAISLAMNPTLPVVLIRDGSLLDEDSLRLVSEMASKADAQVWLERVGEGDECAVIIEDGQVKAMEARPRIDMAHEE